MPFTQTMPKLSPTMESGQIAKWHKQVGDKVEAGDLLVEVATDKATVEFNALDGGWLRQILVSEGQEAVVNQPIAILTESREESIEGYKPEGVETAVPEGPKAAVEAPKPPAAIAVSPKAPPTAAEAAGQRLFASPLARKLAKEKGVDLARLKGTGPSGRIMARDLEKAQPQQAAAGSFELEPMSPMRRIIAQRLQEAKNSIPHFYVSQTIDAEPLVALREQLRQLEIKVTINDLAMRACALALRQHPNVNSGFDPVNQLLIRFKTVDIAVAVSVNGGLITPIVRQADFKRVEEISEEVQRLAKRAKEGKLEPTEYQGGSFTLSNLGMYGITEFAAIINPPQAAIVAVSGIQELPVVRKGVVVPGKVMTLTLSVDHRVIDGVAAAEFIKTLQKFLENPAGLLLNA